MTGTGSTEPIRVFGCVVCDKDIRFYKLTTLGGGVAGESQGALAAVVYLYVPVAVHLGVSGLL